MLGTKLPTIVLPCVELYCKQNKQQLSTVSDHTLIKNQIKQNFQTFWWTTGNPVSLPVSQCVDPTHKTHNLVSRNISYRGGHRHIAISNCLTLFLIPGIFAIGGIKITIIIITTTIIIIVIITIINRYFGHTINEHIVTKATTQPKLCFEQKVLRACLKRLRHTDGLCSHQLTTSLPPRYSTVDTHYKYLVLLWSCLENYISQLIL